jgi:tetratricopeptide (TPR) repeat protein
MVVDNADDEKVIFEPRSGEIDPEAPTTGLAGRPLAEYLPTSPKGSIVLTTRTRKVAEGLVDYEDILDLGPMDINEAVDLLSKKLKKPEGGCTQNDLVDLARQLDCMPLAVSQAAAYVNQRAPRVTLSKYLEDLMRSDDGRAQLLKANIRDPRRDGQGSNSIMTTWYVSFEHIRQAHNSAARLLSLMSLFDREGIPDHLLKGRYLEGQSDMDFENDIATLRDYSLIGASTSEQFEMHRLVQFSTQTWLKIRDELESWQGRYVDILDAAFPSGDYETWLVCRALFPHVQMLMSDSYRIKEKRYREKRAAVLYRGAWYTSDSGRHRETEVMARASLAEREVVLGKDNRQTLRSVFLVATGLRQQGKYKQAQEMHQRALMGRVTILGPEHPDTLDSMNSLAVVLSDQGDDKRVEEILRWTIVVSEKVLGVDHPDTLRSVMNLGTLLSDQGKYAEAEESIRRALVGLEKVLGVDDPDTWGCMVNLGVLLLDQGKYAEAEETLRKALMGFEKVLGVDHPDTLTSVRNLGVLLLDQGKYAEAEEELRRALVGREKVLGVDHPDTLEAVYWLGRVLTAQQKRHEALKLYDRAVDGLTKAFDTEHPQTQNCQSYRAELLEEMDTI